MKKLFLFVLTSALAIICSSDLNQSNAQSIAEKDQASQQVVQSAYGGTLELVGVNGNYQSISVSISGSYIYFSGPGQTTIRWISDGYQETSSPSYIRGNSFTVESYSGGVYSGVRYNIIN